MSVSATIRGTVTVEEILTGNIDSMSAANRTVTHNQFNEAENLTGTTTPPVTVVAAFVQALTGGAATIDLNALTGTNGATVSFNGLKVQAFMIKNLGVNTMTLTNAGGNAYPMFGATLNIVLNTGQWALLYGNDDTPDVNSGVADDLTLAGTVSQTCEIIIVAG